MAGRQELTLAEPGVSAQEPAPAGGLAGARRIIIIVGSMGTGGAERVAATLANTWVAMGREVWLVATYLGTRASSYPLHPKVSNVLLADSLRRTRQLRWPRFAAKASALRRVVRDIAPDVVVSFLTNVNVLTIAALAAVPIPLIISERTDPAGDIELPLALRLARRISYRFADSLVVQTVSAARRYAARLPGVARIAVIGNPLPVELQRSRERARPIASVGRVIAMGRLAPSKGFATLIEVFGEVLRGKAWQLDIWGEGPLGAELQKLICRLSLGQQVALCGTTTRPWEVLAAGQIYMLPSAYEGFPNAMFEAMALGLPCIAYDCPSGPRELSDGGTAAIIVPLGDRQALARALGDLARDPLARQSLGEHAAVFVRERFGQARVMAEWDALFDEVRMRYAHPRGGPSARFSNPGNGAGNE